MFYSDYFRFTRQMNEYSFMKMDCVQATLLFLPLTKSVIQTIKNARYYRCGETTPAIFAGRRLAGMCHLPENRLIRCLSRINR
jgi:hypothetical protein